jgi:hypothetical protein
MRDGRLWFVLTPAFLAAGHYTVLASDAAARTTSVGFANGPGYTLTGALAATEPDLPTSTLTGSNQSSETTTQWGLSAAGT